MSSLTTPVGIFGESGFPKCYTEGIQKTNRVKTGVVDRDAGGKNPTGSSMGK